DQETASAGCPPAPFPILRLTGNVVLEDAVGDRLQGHVGYGADSFNHSYIIVKSRERKSSGRTWLAPPWLGTYLWTPAAAFRRLPHRERSSGADQLRLAAGRNTGRGVPRLPAARP